VSNQRDNHFLHKLQEAQDNAQTERKRKKSREYQRNISNETLLDELQLAIQAKLDGVGLHFFDPHCAENVEIAARQFVDEFMFERGDLKLDERYIRSVSKAWFSLQKKNRSLFVYLWEEEWVAMLKWKQRILGKPRWGIERFFKKEKFCPDYFVAYCNVSNSNIYPDSSQWTREFVGKLIEKRGRENEILFQVSGKSLDEFMSGFEKALIEWEQKRHGQREMSDQLISR